MRKYLLAAVAALALYIPIGANAYIPTQEINVGVTCTSSEVYTETADKWKASDYNPQVLANLVNELLEQAKCFNMNGYPGELLERVIGFTVQEGKYEVWKIKMTSPDGTQTVEAYVQLDVTDEPEA